MPRVKVSIPDPLLQVAADAAHAAGKRIDDLYEAAIAEYVERESDARGSLKSRGAMPRSAVKLTIEISEELFQQADKLAKRQGLRRDVLYAVALAQYVSFDANANTDDVHGAGDARGLPTGRLQPREGD